MNAIANSSVQIESALNIAAAIKAVEAIAVAIRDLGRVPEGHLYAVMMGSMSLDTFKAVVGVLTREGFVKNEGHELIWTGPAPAAQ